MHYALDILIADGGLVNAQLITKHVHRARFRRGVVGLVSVNTLGRARIVSRANGYDPAVSAQRHRAAELIKTFGIGTLDVVLLGPCRAAARREVYRTCFLSRIVILFAVDPFGRAVFKQRADKER